MRRYFAGYGVIGEFVIAEADNEVAGGTGLKQLLYGQAAIFEHLIAAGPTPRDVLQDLARALDKRLLAIRHDESLRAWLGSRDEIAGAEFDRLLEFPLPRELTLALGEPARDFLVGASPTDRQRRPSRSRSAGLDR